jgi:hypothetical protein
MFSARASIRSSLERISIKRFENLMGLTIHNRGYRQPSSGVSTVAQTSDVWAIDEVTAGGWD